MLMIVQKNVQNGMGSVGEVLSVGCEDGGDLDRDNFRGRTGQETMGPWLSSWMDGEYYVNQCMYRGFR